LDYIQLHYKNPSLSRQEIASAAGISTRTLNRFFMEYRKDTPGNIVSSLRLEYARNLLERSHLTVKEIAEESGFRSANFLTRCFRLRYDIPPLEYRKKHFSGGKL
jgi:transcriptional regulator GlxA family with amidase domain